MPARCELGQAWPLAPTRVGKPVRNRPRVRLDPPAPTPSERTARCGPWASLDPTAPTLGRGMPATSRRGPRWPPVIRSCRVVRRDEGGPPSQTCYSGICILSTVQAIDWVQATALVIESIVRCTRYMTATRLQSSRSGMPEADYLNYIPTRLWSRAGSKND